jgi:hypothetical protein
VNIHCKSPNVVAKTCSASPRMRAGESLSSAVSLGDIASAVLLGCIVSLIVSVSLMPAIDAGTVLVRLTCSQVDA